MDRRLVLVVDDDHGTRTTMQDLLSDEGYEVLTAGNAQQALKLAAARVPDIVLTDLEMAGGDGISLIHHLRDRGHHDLPIVVLTSKRVADSVEEARRLGVHAYLYKPVDVDHLMGHMANVLAGEHDEER